MRKNILVQASILTLFMAVGSASAEEVVVPISDMQLEQGVITDISDKEGVPEDVTLTDNIPVQEESVVEPPKENINTGEVTTPPVNQVQVTSPEIDKETNQPKPQTPKPQEQTQQQEVKNPQEDTVVLTEKEPSVEPLAKTGIENNTLAYSIAAVMISLLALAVTRLSKTRSVKQ